MEVPYFLNEYDPDALRFYLTAPAPSPATRPRRFSWEHFVERIDHVLSESEETSWWSHIRCAQCMPGAAERGKPHAVVRLQAI